MSYLFQKKSWIISAVIVAVAIIYLVRLFSLQVTDDYYKRSAKMPCVTLRSIPTGA